MPHSMGWLLSLFTNIKLGQSHLAFSLATKKNVSKHFLPCFLSPLTAAGWEPLMLGFWVKCSTTVQTGRCHDTQYNDIQHNNEKNATLSIMAECFYAECHLCWVPFMLSVTYKPFVLSVIMQSVVAPNGAEPKKFNKIVTRTSSRLPRLQKGIWYRLKTLSLYTLLSL